MTHVLHDLHAEFPEQTKALHRLKLSDPRFQLAADRYREVNRAIHRIETEIAPASDQYLEDLKKQRLALLDEVAAMLAREQAD
ncbi:MAG TPA: DUF465 domain-containing protein [Novosphingobium sp.]